MALGPWAGGVALHDTLGGYFWLYMGSFGIGLGAVAIAFTFAARRVPVQCFPPEPGALSHARLGRALEVQPPRSGPTIGHPRRMAPRRLGRR